jgi:hypothetical protein
MTTTTRISTIALLGFGLAAIAATSGIANASTTTPIPCNAALSTSTQKRHARPLKAQDAQSSVARSMAPTSSASRAQGTRRQFNNISQGGAFYRRGQPADRRARQG